MTMFIDVEGQKMTLFGHIASNYKHYGITWAKIADALEDFAGNLAIEIREKFCSEPNGKYSGTFNLILET